MKLKRIEFASEITNDELRQVAENTDHDGITVWYLAHEGEEELAFVALDEPNDEDTLMIYWIYVCQSKRVQGIGTQVEQKIESLALAKRYCEIILSPVPQSAQWFLNRGYRVLSENNNSMLKLL